MEIYLNNTDDEMAWSLNFVGSSLADRPEELAERPEVFCKPQQLHIKFDAMKSALQKAFAILKHDANIFRPPMTRSVWPPAINPRPSICLQCQFRSSTRFPQQGVRRQISSRQFNIAQTRAWSSQQALRKDEKQQSPPTSDTTKSLDPSLQTARSSTNLPNVPLNGSSVRTAPDEYLPSHIEAQRWTLTKRFNKVLDGLMPRVVLLSQRINSYTGTDYSGIEALRQEIKEQEQLVKARGAALKTAKADLDAARATQSASQKEVVGLLERKHSWSAADLERYMSLIRSEHLNEQAVQGAKDCVAAAEKALEEARTRLEKRERAQYHEEQIWSDTIRRNSTWVTFGLMGLNILLLLANVVAIEPWRRRRLVREFRSALEEHKAHSANATNLAAVEADIYDAVGPVDNLLESLEEEMSATDADATEMDTNGATSEGKGPEQVQEPVIDIQGHSPVAPDRLSIKRLKTTLEDMFSDRIIQTRRVDMTTATLQGIVFGSAVAGLISFLLRQR